MKLIVLDATYAAVLAAVHALSFDSPWNAEAFAALLRGPGVLALAAQSDVDVAGFILLRIAADEAEVLTLAVSPDSRRAGLARTLLAAASALTMGGGVRTLFLEVAEDNTAAAALYRQAGFETAGRRPAYYARGSGPSADALVLRKALTG